MKPRGQQMNNKNKLSQNVGLRKWNQKAYLMHLASELRCMCVFTRLCSGEEIGGGNDSGFKGTEGV